MLRSGTAARSPAARSWPQPDRADGLFRPLVTRGPVGAIEVAALALLCTAVITAAVWSLRIATPLGHDEASYAVLSRHWLSGTPATGVGAHRAPVLPAIGFVLQFVGGGETAFRSVGVVAALLAVVGIWWLGRMVHSPAAGLIGAAVFVFSPTVHRASLEYLTDLPAAAVLVVLAGLLWSELEVRPAPGRRLLLAAPLAWVAYELRYGSALPVALLAGICAVLFMRRLRLHRRLVLQTVGLFTILLLPHLVHSTGALGAPWSRLLHTSRVAGRDYYGEGLADYVRWFPEELAGSTAAVLMVFGLLGTLVLAVRGRTVDAVHGTRDRDRSAGWAGTTGDRDRLRRGLVFLSVPAVGHVISIGLVSHGDPRFVFFAVALLCTAGGAVLAGGVALLARFSVGAAALALGAMAILVIGQVADLVPREADSRAARAEREQIVIDASRDLRTRSGPDCTVLTTYNPQVTWYSACASYHFGMPPTTGRESRLSDDGWMLLFEEGKRQPTGDTLAHYLAVADVAGRYDVPPDGVFGSAVLYRMDTQR